MANKKPEMQKNYGAIKTLISLLQNNETLMAWELVARIPQIKSTRELRLLVQEQRFDQRYKEIIVSGSYGYKIAKTEQEVKEFLVKNSTQAKTMNDMINAVELKAIKANLII